MRLWIGRARAALRRLWAHLSARIGLRLAILGCIALAILDPPIGTTPSTSALRVVLEDRSVSFADRLPSARERFEAAQARALRKAWGGGASALEVFSIPFASKPGAHADPRGTDLGAAIHAALDRLASRPGDIVLLSDGRTTRPGLERALIDAALRGVPIHVLCPERPPVPSVAITALAAPFVVRRGRGWRVRVQVGWNGLLAPWEAVSSEHPLEVELTLRALGGDAAPLVRTLSLPAGGGAKTFVFDMPPVGVERPVAGGLRRYLASLRSPLHGDPSPLDDEAAFDLVVESELPRLWWVAPPEASPAPQVLKRLREAGFVVEPRPVEALHRLSEALPDAVVLFEVAADEIGDAAMAALERALAAGVGLVVAGGRQAFGPGGYDRHAIERWLPVHSRPPEGRRRPRAVVVLLDRSGSMAEPTADGERKFSIAGASLIELFEQVGGEDRIAVVAFAGKPQLLLPFGSAGRRERLEHALAALDPGGDTDVFAALRFAIELVRKETEPRDGSSVEMQREIVLISDGRSGSGAWPKRELQRVLASARREPAIAVSAVAIGSDADLELLGRLSRETGGVLDRVEQVSEHALLRALERIWRRDRRRLWYGRPLPVVLAAAGKRLVKARGSVHRLEVAGIARTALRRGAELIARGGQVGPLAAFWCRGEARVAAYPSPDVEGAFAVFEALLKAVLPPRSPSALRVWREVENEGIRVVVEWDVSAFGETQSARDPDRGAPELSLLLPAARGTAREVAFEELAPGRYRSAPLGPDAGTLGVVVERPGGRRLAVLALKRPVEETALDPLDRSTIGRIARTTGGQAWIEQALTALPPPPRPPRQGTLRTWWSLMAACLFVVERGLGRRFR